MSDYWDINYRVNKAVEVFQNQTNEKIDSILTLIKTINEKLSSLENRVNTIEKSYAIKSTLVSDIKNILSDKH